MQNYLDILPSRFYPDECLVDLYVNGELIGSNYIPRSFTSTDLRAVVEQIKIHHKMIPRPLKGPSP